MRISGYVTVGIAALVVAGCGSGGGSTSTSPPTSTSASTARAATVAVPAAPTGARAAIAAAAAKAKTRKTARVTVSGTTSVAGHEVPIHGRGVTTLGSPGRAEVTSTTAGHTVSVRVIGQDLYLSLGSGRLPNGKRWLHQRVPIPGANDPASSLRLIAQTVDPHVVGHEDVDGKPATRYRITIDFARLAKDPDPGTRAAAKAALAGGVAKRLPADLWIGDDGLPVREKYTMTLRPKGLPGPVRTTNDLRITDYGVPVHVTAPPKSEVTEASSLGQQPS
jgi:hypothetical protein